MSGSPLGDDSSLSTEEKTALLLKMGEKFEYLTAHDSLVLLRNSFAIPKLQYLLCTTPCFKLHSLQHYGDVLRNTVSKVANIHFNMDDSTWLQATSVKLGGLGIRLLPFLPPVMHHWS